jgi:hypothetical protein
MGDEQREDKRRPTGRRTTTTAEHDTGPELPAAFQREAIDAPLVVRPVRPDEQVAADRPRYPSRADAERDAEFANAPGDELAQEDRPLPDPIAAPLPSGWEDGRGGWNRSCVERAIERLGLSNVPDAVSARLGRVLGTASPPDRMLPRTETVHQLGASRASPASSERQVAASQPRHRKESDDA